MDIKELNSKAENFKKEFEEKFKESREDYKEFLSLYPYKEHRENINSITPETIYNPGKKPYFLYYIEFKLKEHGAIKVGTAQYAINAKKQIGTFKKLLKIVVEDSITIADKVDAPWEDIKYFGGDKIVAKKIIYCYNPQKVLPIYKTEHLEHFAEIIDENYQIQANKFRKPYNELSTGQKFEYLNELILKFKEEKIETEMDNFSFSHLLYNFLYPSKYKISGNKPERKSEEPPKNKNIKNIRIWKIAPGSPGKKEKMWPVFVERGYIGVGWFGCESFTKRDYSKFNSIEEIKEAIKKCSNKNVINDDKSIWNFAKEMKIGDYVISNNGYNGVLGIGIIKSEYIGPAEAEKLNLDEDEDYFHYREVEWIITDEITVENEGNRLFLQKTIEEIKYNQWDKIKEAYTNKSSTYRRIFEKIDSSQYWTEKGNIGELSDEKIKKLLSWFVNFSATYKKWTPERLEAQNINEEWIQPEVIAKMSDEELEERYLHYYNDKTGKKQNLIAIKRDRIIKNENFRKSLLYLLNEDVDIKTRIDELMDTQNEMHIDGMGRALITAFLMDFKPDKYCLWNGKTESGFKALGWDNLYRKRGDSNGDVYIKVLSLLEKLKTLGSEFDLSFLDVDLFLHTISAEEEGKEMLAKIKEEYKIRYFLEKLLKGYKSNRKNSLKTIEEEFKSHLLKLSNYQSKPSSFESELFGSDNPYFVLYNRNHKQNYVDYPYFIAYFFKRNSKECYLALNINRRYLKRLLENEKKFSDSYYGPEFREILIHNSSRLSNELTEIDEFKDPMDLYSNSDGIGISLFKHGAICAKKYDLHNLPSGEELESDLKDILKVYDDLNAHTILTINQPKNFFEYLSEKGYFFEQELVENFLLSLKVKPFVIMTGNSGTGKTKLAQLFAQFKGRRQNNSKNGAGYNIVPVGANWTENRHIIGFYNVITGEYNRTNALNLMLESCKDHRTPYFLVLDEMNLSHVERYFSDFLSAMESNESIELHSNGKCEVPPKIELNNNLFVIGTVNIDETTYMFSPKVLDRANTLEFLTRSATDYMSNSPSYEANGNTGYLEDPLSDLDIRYEDINKLKKRFISIKTADGSLLWDELSINIYEFQEALRGADFDFGFRTINEIVRFMYVAWVYEGNPRTWDNWGRYFDAQIMQKMLPKIHGSQRELETVLKELHKLCISGNYPKSAKKLRKMSKTLSERRYVAFTG